MGKKEKRAPRQTPSAQMIDNYRKMCGSRFADHDDRRASLEKRMGGNSKKHITNPGFSLAGAVARKKDSSMADLNPAHNVGPRWDGMPSQDMLLEMIHREITSTETSLAPWEIDETGKKEAPDNRTDQDILLDYLTMRNAEVVEETELSDGSIQLFEDMVYEEGFGGKDGCSQNYWRQRLEKEKRKIDGQKKDVRVWRTPDNQVFWHTNLRVREFFQLGGYRAFPEVVTVELNIRELLSVDVANGTFRAAFVLTTRWYDKCFDKAEYFDVTEMYANTKPYITLDHVDEGDDPTGLPRDASNLSKEVKHSCKVSHKAGIDPPGVLYHSQRIQATFRADFDLHRFPFDTQQLPINMRLWGGNVKGDVDHGRILLPISINVDLAHSQLEWSNYSAFCFSNRRYRFDRQDLQVMINVSRRTTYFKYNIYLVLFLLPSLAFLAFTVPPEPAESPGFFNATSGHWEDDSVGNDSFLSGFESRSGITLTLMLTSVAYKFNIESMLPKAPYLTHLDWYIYGGFLIIAAILFMNSMVMVTEHHYGTERRFDRYDFVFDSSDSTSMAYEVDGWSYWILGSIWIAFNIIMLFVLIPLYTGCSLAWPFWPFTSCCACCKKRKIVLHRGPDDMWTRVATDAEKLQLKEGAKRSSGCLVSCLRCCQARPKLKAALDAKEKRRKKLKERIVRYSETEGRQQGTLHLRRMMAITEMKRIEKNYDEEGKSRMKKYMKNGGHCDEHCCKDRRPGADTLDVELYSLLLLGAGLEEKKAAPISRLFKFHGMDKPMLISIFNDGDGVEALQRMLNDMAVDVQDRIKIIGYLSAKSNRSLINDLPFAAAKIIVIQGSGSYLFQGPLQMEGKLTEFSNCTKKIDAVLAGHVSTGAEVKLTDLANLLYGAVLFTSPLLAANYVYAQRKFTLKTDKEKVVASQVWCGYLAMRPTDEWSGGGAMAVDCGTGELKFGYMEREGQSVPSKKAFPLVSSIDMGKFNQKSDQFFDQIEAAIKKMDCRERADDQYPYADIESDPEAQKDRVRQYLRNDYTVLQEICNPLMKSLLEMLKEVNRVKKQVGDNAPVTGKEPIYIFGTEKMRNWVKTQEDNYGGRCTELLEAAMEFIEWQLPAFLSDPDNYDDATPDLIGHKHKIIFEVCSHEKEARCEHLAFQLALQHGKCDEPAVPMQKILERYATTIGNMAWGNGSTQGLPDGKTVVKATIGLNKVKKILTGELGHMGIEPKDGKTFKPSSKCTEVFKQVKRQIAQELNTIAPMLRIPIPANPETAGGFLI